MSYFSGLLISVAAGFLLIRWLAPGRPPIILHLLLALLLGLSLDGTVAFYTHILSNVFNRWVPIGLMAALVTVLYFVKTPSPQPFKTKKKKATLTAEKYLMAVNREHAWGLLVLCVLAIPLLVSAHAYPLGGWDAWSCWNLKAKFIYLGQENWKDVLAPGLWRSNTNYPLLWPLINVWFWDLGGSFAQAIPMINSILIALTTAGLLFFGLLELTGIWWASTAATVLVMALPFNVTLYTSQYSDSLLGLYLLAAFLCLFLAEKYECPRLKILSVIFLGLMAFTKNEGLVACLIAVFGVFWQERRHKKELKTLALAFLLAFLPAAIFMLFMAPKNEAFINGLTSMDKPATLERLLVIAVYPFFEFISIKWNGFWLLVLAGICLSGKRLWQSTLGLMGWTILLYLGVVLAYYAVNTFFEINWWLSTTLSRILFALIPTLTLWICLGALPLLSPAPKGKQGSTNKPMGA